MPSEREQKRGLVKTKRAYRQMAMCPFVIRIYETFTCLR